MILQMQSSALLPVEATFSQPRRSGAQALSLECHRQILVLVIFLTIVYLLDEKERLGSIATSEEWM